MQGKQRLSAIDRSTPLMSAALPEMPMTETVLIRLLRIVIVGLGKSTEPALKEIGLTEGTFHILCLLTASPGGGASPSELSDLVGASRANMTRIIDMLVADDLVTRESISTDGRRNMVRITARGREAAAAAVPHMADPMRATFALFGPEEKVELDRLLRKLVLSFDQALSMRGKTAGASAGTEAKLPAPRKRKTSAPAEPQKRSKSKSA